LKAKKFPARPSPGMRLKLPLARAGQGLHCPAFSLLKQQK
jgi:hypothetical protein